VDGSTREVVIINDTTGTGRRELARPQNVIGAANRFLKVP